MYEVIDRSEHLYEAQRGTAQQKEALKLQSSLYTHTCSRMNAHTH